MGTNSVYRWRSWERSDFKGWTTSGTNFCAREGVVDLEHRLRGLLDREGPWWLLYGHVGRCYVSVAETRSREGPERRSRRMVRKMEADTERE